MLMLKYLAGTICLCKIGALLSEEYPSRRKIDVKAFPCENVFMRTTLELPDDLFREVKAKAALQGITLKQLLANYVHNGLKNGLSVPRTGRRSRLPIIKRRGRGSIPNLTPELQSKLQQEDDLAKLSRSFGR
jgi:hypothetical protein